MRTTIYILAVCLFSGTCSYAQNAKLSRHKTTLAGTVVLRDVEDKYLANVTSLEMPEPDGNDEQLILRAIKKEIAEKYPHKAGPKQKKNVVRDGSSRRN